MNSMHKQLDDAFDFALCVINYEGGFDSYKFRKGFEEEPNTDDKADILAYLETKISRSSEIYIRVKERIDKVEFLSTDYYANSYPRTFRGAYYKVVLKTIAGIMQVVKNEK